MIKYQKNLKILEVYIVYSMIRFELILVLEVLENIGLAKQRLNILLKHFILKKPSLLIIVLNGLKDWN